MTKTDLTEILDRLEGAFSHCFASPTNGPHLGMALVQKIREEECGPEATSLGIRTRDAVQEKAEREIREAIEARIAAQKAEDDAFNAAHPQQHPAGEVKPGFFSRKKKGGEGINAHPEGDEL